MKKLVKQSDKGEGVRLDVVTSLLVELILLIAAVLFYTTWRVHAGCDAMVAALDQYTISRESAVEMVRGSDELTESVRLFAMTGNTRYVWSYFSAADTSGRRNRALMTLYAVDPDSSGYLALQKSMDESMALMSREYYSMRLTAEADGIDLSTLPRTLRAVTLTQADEALSAEGKRDKARAILFDEEYQNSKSIIVENTRICAEYLQAQSRLKVTSQSLSLNRWLRIQWILIIAAIAAVAFSALTIQRLALRPLRRSVSPILSKQPLRNEGAREFRTLVKAYNALLAETNRREEKLTYNAMHDALTGLYNRSGYEFFLSRVDFTTCALLLVDVDYFKQVNDTHGHLEGDRVLCRLADLLRAHFRENDLLFRFGGDEFCVIMRKTGPLQYDLISQKIERINKSLKKPSDGTPPCSISVGVAFGKAGVTPEELTRSADEAMYKIKSSGKCGCAFSED